MTSGEAPSEAFVLSIVGEMTIYRAGELRETLLAPLGHSRPIHIDLSGVTELDSAGVQLLMLVRRLADTQAKELRIVAYSPAVLDVLELLNLESSFDGPPSSSSADAS